MQSDGAEDQIREILEELGEPPEKSAKKGKEVALTLTPRLANLDGDPFDPLPALSFF